MDYLFNYAQLPLTDRFNNYASRLAAHCLERKIKISEEEFVRSVNSIIDNGWNIDFIITMLKAL